jgi:NAD(P)-dependent dehydrogenase (short-subunit alcohol dehydrogenase family)
VIFGVNVKGVVFTVQKALPLLPDGASVILNASIVATKGLPQWSVYSATKAALRSFARTWASDSDDRWSGDLPTCVHIHISRDAPRRW